LQKGEVFRNPHLGSRCMEFYGAYSGTPWLDRLLKLELVRHTAVTHFDELRNTAYVAHAVRIRHEALFRPLSLNGLFALYRALCD